MNNTAVKQENKGGPSDDSTNNSTVSHMFLFLTIDLIFTPCVSRVTQLWEQVREDLGSDQVMDLLLHVYT